MLIGLIGYGLSAVAFALLALLMLTSWRGRLQGGLLTLAAGLTAAWSAMAAVAPTAPALWQLEVVLELARNAAWLLFVARLTPAGRGLGGRNRQIAAHVPAAFVVVFGLVVAAMPVGTRELQGLTQALIFTGLVTAIAGLVLLEQAFRAMRAGPRKQSLPLVIGLGGILAYDLFLYSQGLLFLQLQQELWSARGFANLFAIPFLLLAARQNPQWSVDVFVSRHVVFYTTSLVGIGIYLLVMAFAAYGLNIVGGDWGFVLQVLFFFGALLVLAWVLFSPRARAALRVFLAKHFYSNKYDYREEWLKLTRRISDGDGSESLRHRVLGALADLVGANAAVIWDTAELGRGGAQSGAFARGAVLGKVANVPATLDGDDALVRFLAQRRWTVNVAAARENPDSHAGLVLPGWVECLGNDALVVPLMNRDQLWGVVALLQPSRVGRLSYEDIDLLRVAGMQVAAVLAQAEADRLLTESRQFEAFNRFAAFIMHDLKNVIAQQSLVVRNAAKYRDDPAFIDDVLDTVSNSVERMQRLLEQLKRGQGEAQVERVDLGRTILAVASARTEHAPAPLVDLPASNIKLRVDRERFAAVLEHLVQNAQEATPADGSVRIVAETGHDGGLVVAVEDTGCGMDDEFVRRRLFRPFDSTKGSKGMGIGAYQAREFMRAMGGELNVATAPGFGTRIELAFPAAILERETPLGAPPGVAQESEFEAMPGHVAGTSGDLAKEM